jgi:hypothetical protein
MIEITDVQFLMPVRVAFIEDGEERVVDLSVDMAKRLAYDTEGNPSPIAEKIFSYLDHAHTLPDDFFAASDEIHERAQQVYDDIEKAKHEHVGDVNGR